MPGCFRNVGGGLGDIRAARRRLGAYTATQQLMPYPDGWSRTIPDWQDLDLLRRGGGLGPLRQVAERWWQQGPLDALKRVLVHVATRPWLSPAENANLALLRAAGDLLDQESANRMVQQVVDLADQGQGGQSYAVRLTVARALPGMLVAAGPGAMRVAAAALVHWTVAEPVPSHLAGLAGALDPTAAEGDWVAELLDWAGVAAHDPSTAMVATEALLALADHHGTAEDVHRLLVRAFDQAPSTESAAGLLRAPRVDDDQRAHVASWLLDRLDEGSSGNERWGVTHLLVAVTAFDDERTIDRIRGVLSDSGTGFSAKADALVQLSVRPELARAVLSGEVVELLVAQEQTDVSLLGDGDDSWVWMAAAAAAGSAVVPSERVSAWLTARIASRPERQWQAARVLGSAARSLPSEQLLPLWSSLVHADSVVVAAEAARHAPAILDAAGERNGLERQVESGLRDFQGRDGALGPLAAGFALHAIGVWRSQDGERARTHASARVRQLPAAPG